MGKLNRTAQNIRQLLASGLPVSAVGKKVDDNGYELHVAVTITRLGASFESQVDIYYPVGSTGQTVRQTVETFDNIDDAIKFSERQSGLPISSFKN